MFSMFRRTGAPQKGGPHKSTKLFHSTTVVCIAARVLNKMSMMTTVRVGGGGYSYIRGTHIFSERAPLGVNPALTE